MAKGRKTGGRTKGTPNRITSAHREAWQATFENLKPDLEGWIREAARRDPGRAADLVIKLAEFHTPKLGRQELVGENGGSIVIEVIKFGGDAQ